MYLNFSDSPEYNDKVILNSYPVSRNSTFCCVNWRVRKEASADNRSIFYRACAKFIMQFVSKINRQVCHGNKKIATTLVCYARLTQDSCSKPVKNRKKPVFNLFIQISGQIWMVITRGYFSHNSSHSKNVASARWVLNFWNCSLNHLLTCL